MWKPCKVLVNLNPSSRCDGDTRPKFDTHAGSRGSSRRRPTCSSTSRRSTHLRLIGHSYTVLRQRKRLAAPGALRAVYEARPELMAKYEAFAEEFS